MVHVGDGAPRRRRVAVGAQVRRRYVVDGFRGRLHRADRRVTAHAGRIGPLERAAGMTALTGDVGVRSVQHEPGGEMIECILRV